MVQIFLSWISCKGLEKWVKWSLNDGISDDSGTPRTHPSPDRASRIDSKRFTVDFQGVSARPARREGDEIRDKGGRGKTREDQPGAASRLGRDVHQVHWERPDHEESSLRCKDMNCIHGSSPLAPQPFLFLPLPCHPTFSDVLKRIVLINIGCPNAKVLSPEINAFS